MSMQQSINRNRIRQARYRRAEKVLRQIRQRIFDYEDAGKLAKAQRVIATCQRILSPLWEAERRTREAIKLERTPSAFEPGCH